MRSLWGSESEPGPGPSGAAGIVWSALLEDFSVKAECEAELQIAVEFLSFSWSK